MGVVVLVTRDHQHRVDAFGDELAFDELEIAVGVGIVDVGPARLGGAEDQPVTRLHEPGGLLEVVDLGGVDVRVVLDVDPPQPVPVRQPDREVAAVLARLSPADPTLLAEHPHEPGQAVVPVVVAGDREHARVLGGRPRQRRLVRADEAALVLRRRADRIHLVAPEDQIGPAWQIAVGAIRPQGRLRGAPRHGVGGIEPVTGVGDHVDPDLVVLHAIGEHPIAERVLQLTLVEIVAERGREHDLDACPCQDAKVRTTAPDDAARSRARLRTAGRVRRIGSGN